MPGKEMISMIKRGDSSFLNDLKSIAQEYDFTIINLECPVKSDEDTPIEKYGPNLGCPVESLDVLKDAGVDLVTLANNHILDYGESALLGTVNACDSKGIATVGVGRDVNKASEPFILKIKDKSLGLINCCEYEFSIATDERAGANHLDPLTLYYQIRELKKNVDYVLVIVHAGHEQFNLPSLRMQKNYRFFIDAGADVVINHHQHCYSGYEAYKGKLIFYGLGNLCFEMNGESSVGWHEGYMVGLKFGEDIKYQLYPYEQFYSVMGLKMLPENAYGEEIKKLNEIISDSDKLKQHVNEYYKANMANVPLLFDPYNNRYTRKLRKLNLLPSIFKGIQIRKMQNHILCESHFDKLKFFFIHRKN